MIFHAHDRIKADWHPLGDMIVIGKYPPPKSARKSIELYNPETGNCVAEIFQPLDKIVSTEYKYTLLLSFLIY